MSNTNFKTINANELVTATGGTLGHQLHVLNNNLATLNTNNSNNQNNQTTQMMTFAMLGLAMRNRDA